MTKIHKSLTADLVNEAAERRMKTLDNPGFCIGCGHEHEGVEPDAEGYECEACGEPLVYGAEEICIRFL